MSFHNTEGAIMRLRYCFMFFPLMGAGTCAIFGVQEYLLAARSSHEPEEISLRDLIKRGPGGNPNIILTDFSLFEDYVSQNGGTWTFPAGTRNSYACPQ